MTTHTLNSIGHHMGGYSLWWGNEDPLIKCIATPFRRYDAKPHLNVFRLVAAEIGVMDEWVFGTVETMVYDAISQEFSNQ